MDVPISGAWCRCSDMKYPSPPRDMFRVGKGSICLGTYLSTDDCNSDQGLLHPCTIEQVYPSGNYTRHM